MGGNSLDVKTDLAFFRGVADDQDRTFRNLRCFVRRCFLDAAVINSVAGFSGGISCPSEVRVITVPLRVR